VEGINLVRDSWLAILAEQHWPSDLASSGLAGLDEVAELDEVGSSACSTASLRREAGVALTVEIACSAFSTT
jgi:hypothetical protein